MADKKTLLITRSTAGRRIEHPTGIVQNIELVKLKEFRRQTQLEIDLLIIQRDALDVEIAEVDNLIKVEIERVKL